MNNPKNTPQPACVAHSLVDSVPPCELVALPLSVKTGAHHLRCSHHCGAFGFQRGGTKLEVSRVGQDTASEEPHSVWLHWVNIESKVVVTSSKSLFNFKCGICFYEICL